MAQKPRTPVHFPRMKVRGRRNRAKLTERRRYVTVFPHAAMTVSDDRRIARFDVIAGWRPGCQRIEITTIKDGYGRAVPGIPPHTVVRPAPRPEPQYKVEFEIENRMSAETWDMLFGRDRDGEG
ncbi:hypothetical protein [Microbacterium sp. H6]|uniref:hypothetical protein n=1 Tax=Microbacterium sp. H6 TaxID=421122 RepID=UPI000DE43B42|nr:hypothetical protein [Microbacterium sp. H6]RBO73493.1 hypothetical protein DSP71_04880 [Microbacterium sp. H6]